MDDLLIQRFAQLISGSIGLQIRPQDYPILSQKILMRLRELRCSHPEDYYKILTAETAGSQKEWLQLIPLITTPESYFFRDRGQFKLLQTVILPQLIARQQQSKQLHLWSAGCSTGEEPYSLSLLLQKLLPNWEEWKIIILGTDINELALQKARQGLYSPWSFRQVDSEIISQSFLAWGSGWKINPQTRKSVDFLNFNLVQDDLFEDSKFRSFDLILCRNVFVYFEKYQISKVLQKFYQVLKPEGYLITAHAELQGVENNPFKPLLFPESVVYQRSDDLEGLSNASPSKSRLKPTDLCLVLSSVYHNQKSSNLSLKHHNDNPNVVVNNSSINSNLKEANVSKTNNRIIYAQTPTEIEEAKQLFQQKKYREAIQKVNGVLETISSNFEAYYLLGKIYANLGQYQEATYYCQRAITVDSLSVLPCYLLLNIAEETNNREEAKKLAKRIIYLSGVSPSSVYAYVKLAFFYEQEQNKNKAKKNYKTALEILQTLPLKAEVEYTENLTVAELKTSLNTLINNLT